MIQEYVACWLVCRERGRKKGLYQVERVSC